MFNNALRRFWPDKMPFGAQQPFNPPQTFNSMPFEGGAPDLGKGGLYGPFNGPFSVPNMGTNVPRNALMGFGGYRGKGMNIRQRY